MGAKVEIIVIAAHEIGQFWAPASTGGPPYAAYTPGYTHVASNNVIKATPEAVRRLRTVYAPAQFSASYIM